MNSIQQQPDGMNSGQEQSGDDFRERQNAENNSNTVKNPDDWATGGEEMTGAQRSYLNTLASEAGEQIDENLSKAEASKKIDELQHKTGRGIDR